MMILQKFIKNTDYFTILSTIQKDVYNGFEAIHNAESVTVDHIKWVMSRMPREVLP